jgi:hypothetical protein
MHLTIESVTMPEKAHTQIDWAAIEDAGPEKQIFELEQRLIVLRERLELIDKAKGVSQKILDLEFSF